MTPEAINRAIAEACGWKPYVSNTGTVHRFVWQRPDGQTQRIGPPGYHSDLNAVHEAVMAQTPEIREKFRLELQWLVAPRTKPSKVSGLVLMCKESYDKWFHATAPQRCEALLKTLGKWQAGGT